MLNKNIFIIFLLVIFFIPNIYAAELTDFDITVDVKSPNKAYVTEIWNVEYDLPVERSKQEFKQQILEANTDLEKLTDIDPNLKPNIYLKNYSNVKINFSESRDQINISYEISDVILQNFFETEEDILWKFNENLLRNLIVNNLYVIPSDSKLTIKIYDPLIIRDPNPSGQLNKNEISWSSISTNEIKLLGYEKKPPKPSFVIISSEENDVFYYLILIFIILISIILIFKEPIEKNIKKFVVKHSLIKPKKPSKEIVFEQDIFDE